MRSSTIGWAWGLRRSGGGTGSMLGVSADDKHCVTVDGKVVVGRGLRHRAGVHRRRPQGQSSPLWPQWAAAWSLVPHSRTLERPTLGSVRSSDPYVTQMCHKITQPATPTCTAHTGHVSCDMRRVWSVDGGGERTGSVRLRVSECASRLNRMHGSVSPRHEQHRRRARRIGPSPSSAIL